MILALMCDVHVLCAYLLSFLNMVNDMLKVETVLKGVVRAEKLETPTDFIEPILQRAQHDHLRKQYDVENWKDAEDFLIKLATHQGKLLKGGEPDCSGMAVKVIYDWQRVMSLLQSCK